MNKLIHWLCVLFERLLCDHTKIMTNGRCWYCNSKIKSGQLKGKIEVKSKKKNIVYKWGKCRKHHWVKQTFSLTRDPFSWACEKCGLDKEEWEMNKIKKVKHEKIY